MTVETRYFKNASVTVNDLTCYPLALDQSGTSKTESTTRVRAYLGCTVGIRVWKRTSAPAETEITAGTPVAQVVTVDGDFHTLYSNTWNCPLTTLNSTDSIVVRVYAKFGTTWYQIGLSVFTTEQLGASQLDAATWTVYYYLSFSYVVATNRATVAFHFDGADNSRITNFTWSIVVVRRMAGDGLTWVVA